MIEKIREKALELGASEAKVISTEDIIIGNFTRVKCQYGCDFYKKCLTCPPFSPTAKEMKKILENYKTGIILKMGPLTLEKTEDVYKEVKKYVIKLKKIIAELEKHAFLEGFHKAFGMASGPCYLCDKCNLENCRFPEIARPSMEACGIDVYETAKKAGLEIKVVKNFGCSYSLMGLLLVE